MDNPFDAMRMAVQQARDVRRAVDNQADALADLLEESLRNVSSYRLKRIKAKLRDFDAVRGRWKK